MMSRPSTFVALCLLALISSASAFAPQSRAALSTAAPLRMFNADGDGDKKAPALQTDDGTSNAADAAGSATEDMSSSSFVKDMNTGEVKEVKWVDPAMRANTNPLEMSWWAYPLFGLPFVLLANDALHFLPKDGPWSFLL